MRIFFILQKSPINNICKNRRKTPTRKSILLSIKKRKTSINKKMYRTLQITIKRCRSSIVIQFEFEFVKSTINLVLREWNINFVKQIPTIQSKMATSVLVSISDFLSKYVVIFSQLFFIIFSVENRRCLVCSVCSCFMCSIPQTTCTTSQWLSL